MKERTQKKKELEKMEIIEEVKEKFKLGIKIIEEELAKEETEENIEHVMTSLKKLGGSGGSRKGENRAKMWKILQKNYPKHLNAIPVGKKDRSGNHKGLKELYLETYLNRMRNRPIKPRFEKLQSMKTDQS